MRRARYKSSESAFYHIFTRLAGSKHYFPFHRPHAYRKLIDTIRTYVSAYCCQLASYKNPELLDPEALQECLLYIELNAVRAGLVTRPEQWKASSTWARFNGQDQNLMPLERIFAEIPPEEVFAFYRNRLYQRGAITSSENKQEYNDAVRFRHRLRFFTDGLAVGSQERVARLLGQLQKKGTYRYRKKPIPQLSGFLFTLREQRSNAVN